MSWRHLDNLPAAGIRPNLSPAWRSSALGAGTPAKEPTRRALDASGGRSPETPPSSRGCLRPGAAVRGSRAGADIVAALHQMRQRPPGPDVIAMIAKGQCLGEAAGHWFCASLLRRRRRCCSLIGMLERRFCGGPVHAGSLSSSGSGCSVGPVGEAVGVRVGSWFAARRRPRERGFGVERARPVAQKGGVDPSAALRLRRGECVANVVLTRYWSCDAVGIASPSSSRPRVVPKTEGSTVSGSASCSMAMPLERASTATAS